jgi:uncharacterized phiE125 gp8 family phage protein
VAGLELVSAPTGDPVSLAEAKAHCRIVGTEDDGLLAGYILAAREYVEADTERRLALQTWRAYFDRRWPCYFDGHCYRTGIVLPYPPLQSVSSVTYVDPDGDTQTLATDQYVIARFGHRGLIEPAKGVTWPAVRAQLDAIRVEFVCGYTALPEPLRQAILLLVGHFYENRETVSAGNLAEVPFAVERLVSRYRLS